MTTRSAIALRTLALLLAIGGAASAAAANRTAAPAATRNPLPEGPILAGYANWGQCDEGLVQAARDGLNVLLWFSINLAIDEATGEPTITGPAAAGPIFYDCVAGVVAQMEAENLPLAHLVSIGGWNSPHPADEFGGAEFFAAWKRWNDEEVARPEQGWLGFSGFDWDIEGNDDPESPSNTFTMATLRTMGDMSVLAKQERYVVAMAPAQSYLDCTTAEFSRSVTFAPHEPWQEDFFYHGRNTYAYLLAEYGSETFDFISIQLYEGYSAANWAISENAVSPSDYLEEFVECVLAGWEVDFEAVPEAGLPRSSVNVTREQLVVGLANGWAAPPPFKFLLLWPEDVGTAYRALREQGDEPRGFMFWNIADEGEVVPGTERELWLTRELYSEMGLGVVSEEGPRL